MADPEAKAKDGSALVVKPWPLEHRFCSRGDAGTGQSPFLVLTSASLAGCKELHFRAFFVTILGWNRAQNSSLGGWHCWRHCWKQIHYTYTLYKDICHVWIWGGRRDWLEMPQWQCSYCFVVLSPVVIPDFILNRKSLCTSFSDIIFLHYLCKNPVCVPSSKQQQLFVQQSYCHQYLSWESLWLFCLWSFGAEDSLIHVFGWEESCGRVFISKTMSTEKVSTRWVEISRRACRIGDSVKLYHCLFPLLITFGLAI